MATTISKIYEAVCEGVANTHLEGATYTPTKAYTGGLPNKVVKKGSKGTDVKHLQTFLNWCLNPNPKLAVDGIAGSKTISALKKWQKQYGLKADGVFGSKSRAKAVSIINAHKPKPIPTTATNGDKIAAKAREYAWTYGTDAKRYEYKTGSAKGSYKTALKKYMHKKAKISQSDCGYFVNTTVRSSGLGNFTALPAKASQAYPALPKNFSIVHKGIISDSIIKTGDIIRYRKNNGHQHTVIYIGNGYIAHASRGHAFPRVSKSKPWSNSNVKKATIQVIRAK